MRSRIAANETSMDWDRFLSTVDDWRLALPVRKAVDNAERDFGELYPRQRIQTTGQQDLACHERFHEIAGYVDLTGIHAEAARTSSDVGEQRHGASAEDASIESATPQPKRRFRT